VEVGHAQNIVAFTKTAKPVALSYDWVAQNLYWLEVDTASLKGQVMAAKADGRYRRSVVPRGIDTPTSLAANPVLGQLYWAQAGSEPRIETSWMDGTKRKVRSLFPPEFPGKSLPFQNFALNVFGGDIRAYYVNKRT